MAVIVIDKVPPYDGEHDLDLSYFNLGELARIFDIAKLRPVHLTDALVEQDPRLRVALAVVAIEREGRSVEWLEPFWKVRPEDLFIDLTRGPGRADPVDPQSSPLTNGNESGESERMRSSGEHGLEDGASSPASDPSDIGNPGSANTSE